MSEDVRRRRLRVARVCAAGAVTWAVGLLVAALLAPSFDDQTISNGNGLTLTSKTFVQVTGTWVLGPLAVPLLAALLVLAVTWRPVGGRWPWLAVLAVLVLGAVTILTIGAAVLPVAVLLAIALRLVPGPPTGRATPRPRPRESSPPAG